jgi:VWFA-related protein
MRILKAVFLASALALPALAQQQPLAETIEVRVANIDVVVRDKAGNPVTGLTKDDFVLYDDDVVQKISNFYEVRRGMNAGSGAADEAEVPVEVRQRRVAVFVDAASLTASRKSAILDALRRFFATGMRPEDRAMIVVWRAGLHTITPFTNNKTSLDKALETVATYAPIGESSSSRLGVLRRDVDRIVETAEKEASRENPLVTWPDAFTESRSMVERYARQVEHEQEEMATAMETVAASMSGLEGKKVLLFVGETFSEHPGAEMNTYVTNLFKSHLNSLDMPELETVSGFMGSKMPDIIDQLGKNVGASGVAIYAIGAAATDGNISAENQSVPDQSYAFTRDANTARALEKIATATGGVAVTRTSNFDLAFDTINKDLGSYYSIGYKPPGEGARQHKILVKTTNKQYAVRSRQSFVTRSTDDQMEDRAIANLYTQPARNDWPIEVKVGAPEPDQGKFKVPVQVIMPATVTMLPQGDKIAGGFTLYFVVGNADGGMSPVLRRPQNFSFPKESEESVRAEPMTFSTQVRVNKGENILSVAIIDQLSGAMGFTRTPIVAK